jgi:hypothetical protein
MLLVFCLLFLTGLVPSIELGHERLMGCLPVAQTCQFAYEKLDLSLDSISTSVPLEISFNAPFVAFLDLKGLWETFVVLLCEWEVTLEGMLSLPLPPALNLNGIEARMYSFKFYRLELVCEFLRCGVDEIF